MTKEEFTRLVGEITEVYPSFQITKDKLRIWYSCLDDIDYKDAFESLIQHFKNSKFPPTIADIRNGVPKVEKVNLIKWYSDTENRYPKCFIDDGCKEYYFSMFDGISEQEKERKAKMILQLIINYITKCEVDSVEPKRLLDKLKEINSERL